MVFSVNNVERFLAAARKYNPDSENNVVVKVSNGEIQYGKSGLSVYCNGGNLPSHYLKGIDGAGFKIGSGETMLFNDIIDVVYFDPKDPIKDLRKFIDDHRFTQSGITSYRLFFDKGDYFFEMIYHIGPKKTDFEIDENQAKEVLPAIGIETSELPQTQAELREQAKIVNTLLGIPLDESTKD